MFRLVIAWFRFFFYSLLFAVCISTAFNVYSCCWSFTVSISLFCQRSRIAEQKNKNKIAQKPRRKNKFNFPKNEICAEQNAHQRNWIGKSLCVMCGWTQLNEWKERTNIRIRYETKMRQKLIPVHDIHRHTVSIEMNCMRCTMTARLFADYCRCPIDGLFVYARVASVYDDVCVCVFAVPRDAMVCVPATHMVRSLAHITIDAFVVAFWTFFVSVRLFVAVCPCVCLLARESIWVEYTRDGRPFCAAANITNGRHFTVTEITVSIFLASRSPALSLLSLFGCCAAAVCVTLGALKYKLNTYEFNFIYLWTAAATALKKNANLFGTAKREQLRFMPNEIDVGCDKNKIACTATVVVVVTCPTTSTAFCLSATTI